MKKELKTLGKALWAIVKSLVSLMRYIIGYPMLFVALAILPGTKNQAKTAVKNSRLSKSKVDYIVPPAPKNIKVK